MRTCVIFNPAAKGDKARHFQAHLGEIAASATLKPTTAPGGGRPLAAEALAEGYNLIVAAGGDGTINEVVNGMGDVPDGFDRARLGVLPLGTANVFARELGIPFKLNQAWRIIQHGQEVATDLGLIEHGDPQRPKRQYFVQLGGSGLDARSIELLDMSEKKRYGALAYILAGFRAIREMKPLLVVEAGTRQAQGELVLFGNGRLYGGPFKLFPRASLKDGLLDLTVFPQANYPTLFRFGLDGLLGRWNGIAGSIQFQAPCVKLRTSDGRPWPFEIDGDNAGHLPAVIRICPGRLKVMSAAA